MTRLYPQYLSSKDKYCFTYFGLFKEFVRQLIYIRDVLEKQHPEIDLYIACKDEFARQFVGCPGLIPQEHFIKNQYGYVKEIHFDQVNHPLLQIIEENGLTFPNITQPKKGPGLCVITTPNLAPFPSLTECQFEKIKKHVLDQGYSFGINIGVDNCSWVIGVENDELYEAAFKGIPTTLICPNKESSKVFTKLLPGCDLLHI